MLTVLLLALLCCLSTTHAFSFPSFLRSKKPPLLPKKNYKQPILKVMPLTEDNPSSSSDDAPLLDWSASGSIGSLLMQMQKKEEEMRKLNKTLLDKEQALDLSSTDSSNNLQKNGTTSTSESLQDNQEEQNESMAQQRQSELSEMDYGTAKELDDAVTIRLSSSAGRDAQLLELPDLYQVLRRQKLEQEEAAASNDETTTAAATVQKQELPPLSKPEHYEDRIGRDMRHLAVSIASCIDDPAEWRVFCQQISGGIVPLIDCIREGAKNIRERRDDPPPISDDDLLLVSSRYEESFLAASSACRALRDLCALSLDLAAVITDGLLRANAAEPLIHDLVTLLKYAHDNTEIAPTARRRLPFRRNKKSKWPISFGRNRKEDRLQCKLFVLQLLLAMTCAGDSAVDALRSTEGLREIVLKCSSYARKERTRRWLRYPGEMIKSSWYSKLPSDTVTPRRRPFIEAAALTNDLNGRVQGTANQLLAAMGYNEWVPKIPGQKGLRILCLDGGGSRGMTSVMAVNSIVEALDGMEVADCFDFVVGTSTGAIIAFLIGLKRETSEKAVKRYDVLIPNIFRKSTMSTPLLLFTTASYDESPFMDILSDILGDSTMLDSRADPSVPYVFGVTSKMSSTPTHVALFRNYNYNGGELPDPFLVKPEDARESLGLTLDMEDEKIRSHEYARKTEGGAVSPGKRRPVDGSRHPGSFRVLQRYALRASTAAPTVFKPVMMGGEMYCDGGIVASNPTAIGIHEARSVFPDVPIELVVSIGTGGFLEQKSAPRIGWDGIIGQIINSATDGEQIHHILEDILGDGGTAQLGSSVSNTCYMRFNPVLGLPDDFPIDITDPIKLENIKQITRDYMNEPEQQRKLQDLADVLKGRSGLRKWLKR